jgi:hypothetical protein
MIQQKAKYYPDLEVDNIVPIKTRPNLIALDTATPKQEMKGTDEKGDWVLINFVHGESTYYDYEVKDVDNNGVKKQQVTKKILKEEEWDQIKVDKQCEDTQKTHLSVPADVSSLKNSTSISSRLRQRTSTTVKKILYSIIEYLS